VDTFAKVDTMARMAPETPPRRTRRSFDEDFKAQALRQWVERARADRTGGRTGLTTAERDELAKLRKENRELRVERDILRKAAAFFAKHQA
jgi:transposase